MSIEPGHQLAHYRVTAKLGEGGMGEVWRATDTKLKRDVAIKVLPAAFTEDQERLARFEREAQLLAQLQHPNIASIYGLEEAEGSRALVMELVEGPTLAERLEQESILLSEVFSIAKQIAEALEEAHEKGIVHRDLKPQNVKAATGGKVKVLDFGLAKAMDPNGTASGGSASQLAASPTLTLGATQMGVILGTAAYMAPEQAKGMAVDKRADIWAFGVVLFEMLTGSRLFEAPTVPETLAQVLTRAPDLDQLPEGVPAAIRRLLRRCLERDPNRRLHDIADARIVIDEVLAGEAHDEAPGLVGARVAAQRGRGLQAVAALVGGIALGALVASLWLTRGRQASGPELRARFEIPAPVGTALVSGLAISRDGRQIAFVARGEDGRETLWVRSLDSTAARQLPGTTNAIYPFWAPDGRRIGFFAQSRLKVADLIGGQPRALTETGTVGDVRGGSWNDDDLIVYAPSYTGPLFVIPAAGGTPEPVTRISAESGIGTHRFPNFLPDGRRFLFYASEGTGIEPGTLYLGSLDGIDPVPVGPANSTAHFVEPGFLVYVRGDSLVAHRFDPDSGRFAGAPTPLGISLPGSVSVSGQRSLSASAGGLLVFRADKRAGSHLVWVDREGEELDRLSSDDVTWHYAPRISPDGTHVAVAQYEPGSTSGGVWIYELARGVSTRITFDEGDDTYVAWSPDGRRLAYSSFRGATESGIYLIDPDRAEESRLWSDSSGELPQHWTPDGRRILIERAQQNGRTSLWIRDLEGETEPVRLGPERATEKNPALSPDARWLAYVTDSTRRDEVYVRRLDGSGGAVRVSADGGVQPCWAPDGRELYYVDPLGRMMSVRFASLDPLTPGAPEPLFHARLEPASDRQYDVSPDGTRFLLNRSLAVDSVPISVEIGWQGRLEESRPR